MPERGAYFLPRRRRRRASGLRRAFDSCRGAVSRAFSGFAIRLICLVLVVGAGYGARLWITSARTRNIRVCVVSDFPFRDQRPNWKEKIGEWFSEVNRIFAPAKVHWDAYDGGEAYAMTVEGRLSERRNLVSENNTCKADIVLGLSGTPDRETNSSIVPFDHIGLIAVTAADSDAMAVTVLARGLAKFFGVSLGTQAIILADGSDGGVLDGNQLAAVGRLKNYDFARGIGALQGRWEGRALSALETAFAGAQPSPPVQAQRVLARAFSGVHMRPQAIAHFRDALRGAPREASLHFELAMELLADSQPDEARAELRQASGLDPGDARPYAALGAILLNERRTDDAIDALRAATRLNPNNAGYASALGRALSMQVGRLDEAAAAFEAALRLKSNESGDAADLAEIASDLEQARALVRAEEARVREHPSSAEAHIRLGLAQAAAADRAGARKSLERAMELDPRNGAAHLAMARLEYLEGRYPQAGAELEIARADGVQPRQDFVDAVKRRATSRTF